MKRRVVVTGVGLITSLGTEVEHVWKALLEARSGISRTTLFDASNFPTKIAAEVRGWNQQEEIARHVPRWKEAPRQTGFAVGAARRAVESSMLNVDRLDPTRLGVYLGCGDNYQDFGQFVEMVKAALDGDSFDMAAFIKAGFQILDPARELELEPHMPVGHVASMFNAQGPACSSFTACAASSQAVGEATDLIRRGAADVMLAGGTHSLIHPFGVTGLNLLTALSTHRNDDPTKASRPFDRDRDGFVLGEGAGVVVLEDYDHAVGRGAPLLGEIKGYGSSADAYRITDSHPEGRGAAASMQLALDDARLNPEDIDYINAHGTSTEVNDKMETAAIKRVFGSRAYSTPVSSTKSMTGHLLAAAGVTELAVCLMALRDSALPPTINYEHVDQQCDLDYVPNEARDARCVNVLSNSFGFGGQNVALVVSRVA